MSDDPEILQVLHRHGVPFVVIGGHAVNFHGYARVTEDVDILWLRSSDSEQSLAEALAELDARFIGDEIDPKTGIERDHPVTLSYIQTHHLMMLVTRNGFLDLFDYVPGLPDANAGEVITAGLESDGVRYASLHWLREMKKASGRGKDLLDLDHLPT
jgi:hypothetical protein